MKTLIDLIAIVDRCAYPGFEFKVGTDGGGYVAFIPWLQIVCPDGFDTATGEPLPWKGRKWKLSFHMTDTEVVQTVWVAIQRALLHEASELFKFDGASIYDRHLDVHALAKIARGQHLDGRPPA